MIKMKNIALASVLLIASLAVNGQERDFQSWYTLGASYRITERIKAEFENETRFRENSSLLYRNQFDVGGEYKINNNLETGLFYRFVADEPMYSDYSCFHRFYIQITYTWKPKRFELISRLRLASDAEDSEAFSDAFGGGIHREKLTLRYNIRKTSFTPYIAGEIFFPVRSYDHYMQKYRLFAGFTYRLNKANRIGISIMYQHRYGDKNQSLQTAILVDYSIRIK